MAKRGRRGVSYEKFVETWEALQKDGNATTAIVQEMIGGSYSTITKYREQYEREQRAKALSFVKQIKLSDAVVRAIAAVKVEEITVLDKNNQLLEVRIDECTDIIKNVESKLSDALVNVDELKSELDEQKLQLERKLAASQARIEDLLQREQQVNQRYESVNQQYIQAKQEAAVAQKEIQLLREQLAVTS